MASKVHRLRFYNPKPHLINCIHFNKQLKHIALARDDASIEVWDVNHAPFLLRSIPGVENGSVEALVWVQDRLMSTGLGGALVEWDIATLTPKNTVLLTGSGAWCLDVNPTCTSVAVGTEQGYINLYSVENNEIVYQKLFDKQEGRVLCCKFDKTGSMLVTGSIDSIRVWNVQTGHATSRISVTRRKEVFVWSVAMLSDNTIVSGDSQGRLTFWDGTLGEQIESYTTQKADILSVAVSDDEKNIYCSGMDPTISHFVKVDKAKGKQSGAQWVKNVQRHIHEHDVRALAVCNNILVSVGVDGYLTFSKYPPKWLMRIPPMIPGPRFSVAPKKRLVLLRYKEYLEIWKLGSYKTNKNGKLMYTVVNAHEKANHNKSMKQLEQDSAAFKNGVNKNVENQCLKLAGKPVKIATIITLNKKQIQCCTISLDSEFIIYSTDTDVRMLRLETDDPDENHSTVSMSKLRVTGLPACSAAAFAGDSRSLIACAGAALFVVHVDADAGATVVQTIATDKWLKSAAIIHLYVSDKCTSGASYIVAGDSAGAVAVWADSKTKYSHHVTLPTYRCVPSCLTVDCVRETLIIAYVDQKILEYDLINKKFTGWPGAALPAQWLERETPATAVTAHPARNAVVFQDTTSLWILDRSQAEEDEPQPKKKPQHAKSLGLRVIPVKYLAGFAWLGADEAMMLEVLPEKIVSQLPPSTQLNQWSARP